ncbi:hypothetical protein PMAYCL1PPCAC_30600, partial [Pristionchus mayeri]
APCCCSPNRSLSPSLRQSSSPSLLICSFELMADSPPPVDRCWFGVNRNQANETVARREPFDLEKTECCSEPSISRER